MTRSRSGELIAAITQLLGGSGRPRTPGPGQLHVAAPVGHDADLAELGVPLGEVWTVKASRWPTSSRRKSPTNKSVARPVMVPEVKLGIWLVTNFSSSPTTAGAWSGWP